MWLHYFFTRFAYLYTYLFFWSSNVMVYYFQLQVGQQCCHPLHHNHSICIHIFICLCMVVSLNENYKHPNLCSFHGPHILLFSLWIYDPFIQQFHIGAFLNLLSLSLFLSHKHIWLTRSLKYNVGSWIMT